MCNLSTRRLLGQDYESFIEMSTWALCANYSENNQKILWGNDEMRCSPSKKSYWRCVCVCLCCLRACAYVHTGKLACVPYTSGGQRFMFRVFLSHSPPYVWRPRGLLLDLELTISARSTTGQWAPGTPLSPPFPAALGQTATAVLNFYMSAQAQNSVSTHGWTRST